MIKELSTTYVRKDSIDFIIDDDKEMSWISSFESSKFDRFFIVIDKNVKKIWGKLINKRLKKHNKPTFIFEVDAFEKSKSISYYPKLVTFLEKHKCNLSDLVIVIGGGILIDLVSFTCSTYMRALPFYAFPTTLIGQIDASTAGKTCLNTENSKNLLGTFYYPLKVYNNINFLKTNDPYYLRQGYSEVFKYGLLGSKRLIQLLSDYIKRPSTKTLIEMVKLAIETRIKIRKKNPLASNLGHTFGHAMEKLSNYNLLHGDAISAGTVMAIYFSKKENLIQDKEIRKIILKMKELRLNMYIEKNLDVNKLVDTMMRDKKSSSKYVNLVLIKGIAEPFEGKNSSFYKTTPKKLKKFLSNFLKQYPYKRINITKFIKKKEIKYN